VVTTKLPSTIYAWPSDVTPLCGSWAQTRYPEDAEPFIRRDAPELVALVEAMKPIVWEDTREVSFDDTVMWGVGYDFDPWELCREEADTSDGRFAVWKCPAHGWSYYGGSQGSHKGSFADQAEAKDAVRSRHMQTALAAWEKINDR